MKLIPQKTRSDSTDSYDGIGRGMEFAVLVLMFLGIGYMLDRWFSTKPIFMIVFVLLALVGQFASMYYGYDERMKALEQIRADGVKQGDRHVHQAQVDLP